MKDEPDFLPVHHPDLFSPDFAASARALPEASAREMRRSLVVGAADLPDPETRGARWATLRHRHPATTIGE